MDTPLHNLLGPLENDYGKYNGDYDGDYNNDCEESNSDYHSNIVTPYSEQEIVKSEIKKQTQNKKPRWSSYRGERTDPRDSYIKSKFTKLEFISKSYEWKKLIIEKGLKASEIIRAKQLRRRELCKGYSKETRRRSLNPDLSDKKQKKEYLQQLIKENTQLKEENTKLKQLLNNYM